VGDITTKFGENAGKIWSVLNEKGCIKKSKILKHAKITEDEFSIGIGWLAKENKISREDKVYFKLESTNLDSEIGAHAGKVWKILDIWGDADFTTLKRLSDLDKYEVQAALGWLARENKINYNENKRFELK